MIDNKFLLYRILTIQKQKVEKKKLTRMIVNSLYSCDNLFLLNGMNSQSVDLIYLDPPFNSKRTYSAPVGSKSAGASFKDMWRWNDVNLAYLERLYSEYPEISDYIGLIGQMHSKPMMAYVAYMTQRLFEMRRILKPNGSIYLHVDPTASHYLKNIMDGIFGKSNFRNEIVWCYTQGGRSIKDFPKKHDIILRYSKGKDYIFNSDSIKIPYTTYSEKAVDSFSKIDEDGRHYKEIYGTGKSKKYRYYKDDGKTPYDWWVDIYQMTGNKSKAVKSEAVGYPTQKPLALLHRIIKASSNEGDVVFDPFCGCATACVASQQLNRKWIGCDIEEKAADILVERLSDDAGMFSDFIHVTTPPQRTDVENIEPTLTIKKRLYQQQSGNCNGCGNEYLIKDFEIDHVVPKSKGGGDYYENYQLLCGHCNRTKSNKPMEYLLAKVAKISTTRKAVSYD